MYRRALAAERSGISHVTRAITGWTVNTLFSSSMTQMEFDFWEFVDCAKCRLPFLSDSGSTVPFWLTECGHVVCNNHLSRSSRGPSCTSLIYAMNSVESKLRAVRFSRDTTGSSATRGLPVLLCNMLCLTHFDPDGCSNVRMVSFCPTCVE
jgi:hypothetical protein